MILFTDTLQFHSDRPTAVAIGKFDGLHRGHETLLTEILKEKERGLLAAAFTFHLDQPHEMLSTKEEKEALFSGIGIDLLIECPFSDEIRTMRPLPFLQMLKERLHMEAVVAGTDCRFGYRAEGDAAFLTEQAKTLGFRAVIVEKQQHEGRDISSTWIREEIKNGRIKEANQLLGYAYFISGEVAHGHAIGGKRLNTPTLNLIPEEDKLLPPFGVYVTETEVRGQIYQGISNLGVKPTIGDREAVTLETHLFEFAGDLYGEPVTTRFLHFLRPEQRFDSLETLKGQILSDIQRAQRFFGE